MTLIAERAPAKVNLTLEILGRRADGFHELSSLVAFADVCDAVTIDTEGPRGLVVSGPMAAHLAGPNILDKAVALLCRATSKLAIGTIYLEKRLPVAAGLGGGSANAAALLRAISRANPDAGRDVDWHAVAARLGADVPVCLAGEASWMRGIGDVLSPLRYALPRLDVVLVNPMAAVPADKTAQVFRKLGARPGGEAARHDEPEFADRARLVAYLRRCGNDLAEAAATIVPEMRDVLAALANQAEADLVAVSGAGPTCFAILPDAARAQRAAEDLRLLNPHWWIETAVIA
ncbi:MAG: 4-(cytidine 5'-diphospho)-2-C-methyl-D-erythritol kinase [Hyphomicrobium sp.]|jgi:4-diphosphocytidyl-2-C-methyl-D-erythritol kinase